MFSLCDFTPRKCIVELRELENVPQDDDIDIDVELTDLVID
jgi:hypothetical protein